MKCYKCGSYMSDDMQFCPYCGSKFQKGNERSRKESDDSNQLTLGLVKILSTALGASVMLNMKLLKKQSLGDTLDDIKDSVKSANKFTDQASKSVKEADRVRRNMEEAVEDAFTSFSDKFEAAFGELGKTLDEVSSRFTKAMGSMNAADEKETKDGATTVDIVFEDEDVPKEEAEEPLQEEPAESIAIAFEEPEEPVEEAEEPVEEVEEPAEETEETVEEEVTLESEEEPDEEILLEEALVQEVEEKTIPVFFEDEDTPEISLADEAQSEDAVSAEEDEEKDFFASLQNRLNEISNEAEEIEAIDAPEPTEIEITFDEPEEPELEEIEPEEAEIEEAENEAEEIVEPEIETEDTTLADNEAEDSAIPITFEDSFEQEEPELPQDTADWVEPEQSEESETDDSSEDDFLFRQLFDAGDSVDPDEALADLANVPKTFPEEPAATYNDLLQTITEELNEEVEEVDDLLAEDGVTIEEIGEEVQNEVMSGFGLFDTPESAEPAEETTATPALFWQDAEEEDTPAEPEEDLTANLFGYNDTTEENAPVFEESKEFDFGAEPEEPKEFDFGGEPEEPKEFDFGTEPEEAEEFDLGEEPEAIENEEDSIFRIPIEKEEEQENEAFEITFSDDSATDSESQYTPSCYDETDCDDEPDEIDIPIDF